MLRSSALYQYLQTKSPEYAAKAIELHDSISGWLAYIPQSFPHYTRHTVEHSEEIVVQASSLLFVDGNPKRPVVNLSGVEAYSLIAASYLHDAGMVASDEQKAEILNSPEWKEWTEGGGGGAVRYSEIVRFRESSTPSDDALRNFLADIQVRFLIAEFVRLKHHFRSGRLVEQHQSELARFAFDDPVLTRTIADICVSHGLSHHELHDDARYPDRRTIRGELINVMFVSLIFRLADLLDMSSDRACPLLLNAASPLPSESLAHWTQYQRITHRLVAHDRIEIHAECQNQLEHRYLQDWCSWLVDESEHAGTIMAHSRRHNEWVPPMVSIEGSNPSIRITPSPEASYVPSRWRLDLDPDIILERLVYDLHSNTKVFLRELIQNALDATRCQIFLELAGESPAFSGAFTRLDKIIRDRYPVCIDLVEREFTSPLSGERETRQVLTISDYGIGMDNEVIEKYFLQIGRSFYSSDEFRREFGFFASSRFGIGFLSVFAVSDHVEVDTLKAGGGTPIKLLLTGPRKYLLSERGTRSTPGTSVEVLLREKFEPDELTTLVREWCRRVEFPIKLNDLGTYAMVEAESPDQFVYTVPDVTSKDSFFSVVSFPIERPGIEGELYVFVHTTKEGDSWADWKWARNRYPTLHPEAITPDFPDNLVCINGIAVSGRYKYAEEPMAHRLDFRHPAFHQSLARTDLGRHYHTGRQAIPEVESRWGELLTTHLSNSAFAKKDDSWTYKQRLVGLFTLSAYWEDLPGTIEYVDHGQLKHTSLNEFLLLPEFCTTFALHRSDEGKNEGAYPDSSFNFPYLTNRHIDLLSNKHRNLIFGQRELADISLQSGSLILTWTTRRTPPKIVQWVLSDNQIEVISLPFHDTVGFTIHLTTDNIQPCVVLNAEHSLIQWMLRIKEPCLDRKFGLIGEQYHQVVSLLLSTVRFGNTFEGLKKLTNYLNGWMDLEDLPKELYPPKVELRRDCFVIPDMEG